MIARPIDFTDTLSPDPVEAFGGWIDVARLSLSKARSDAEVCGACKTINFGSARFCKGCAGRLPAFASTAPSAQASRASSQGYSPALPASGSAEMLPAETAGFWARLGVAVLLMGIGFIGWFMYVTQAPRPPASLVSMVPAPASLPILKPKGNAAVPPTNRLSTAAASTLSAREGAPVLADSLAPAGPSVPVRSGATAKPWRLPQAQPDERRVRPPKLASRNPFPASSQNRFSDRWDPVVWPGAAQAREAGSARGKKSKSRSH